MELKYINMSYLNPYLWLRVHPSCRGKIAPNFFCFNWQTTNFHSKILASIWLKNVHKQVHPLVFSLIFPRSHIFSEILLI